MNIIPTIKRRKGHSLHRSCHLKHVIEGKRERVRSDGKTKKK
jgi:hypothetical protein